MTEVLGLEGNLNFLILIGISWEGNTRVKRKIQSKSDTKRKYFVIAAETSMPGNCDETRSGAFSFSYIKLICRKELSISL